MSSSIMSGQGIVTGTTVSPLTTNLVAINPAGEAMYWIVFGFFSISALAIGFLTWRKPPAARSHGYCTVAILTTASLAYFSMATQGGYAYVKVYFESNTARAIYYARYVDWTITTPLLLLDILLLAGLPVGDTLWIVFADIAMIVTGLFGAVLPNRYKWGWFGLGCLFMVFIMWGLLWHGRKAAFLRSKRIGGIYSFLSLYLLALWWVYPIAWGLCEGGNVISSEAEAIFYGCLDLCTKFVFGWMIFLMAEPVVGKHRKLEETERGIVFPSLLAAPINAPLTGVWTGAEASTTKRRVAPAAGTEPVAGTGTAGTVAPAVGTAGGAGDGVTAHPGGIVGGRHEAVTGPVTAHETPFARDAAASV